VETIVREDDRPVLPQLDLWLDGVLEANHPLEGKLLQLSTERLSFLPVQGIAREDVVLPPDILEELERSFAFLAEGCRHPEALRHRAVLLAGMPGVGKTLACKWLAGLVSSTVLWIAPGTVWEMGPSAIFDVARKLRPVLMILEDLDVASGQRDGSQPLGDLLTQLDGFAPLTGIGIVATTNHPEALDHALDPRKRPGRFHRMITVEPPGPGGRRVLLERLLGRSAILPETAHDLAPRLAQQMDTATGAQLAEIVKDLEHSWLWEVRHGREPELEAMLEEVTGYRPKTGVGFAPPRP